MTLSIPFEDSHGLSLPSAASSLLCFQVELIDFARKYYESCGDRNSLVKASELRKIELKVFEIQDQAIRDLLSKDIFRKYSEYQSEYEIESKQRTRMDKDVNQIDKTLKPRSEIQWWEE